MSAYQAARAVFDEKELVDLTIAISLMNSLQPHGHQLPEHAAGRTRKMSGGALA